MKTARLPRFNPPWFCGTVRGSLKAASLAIDIQLRSCEPWQVGNFIQEFKTARAEDPDQIASLIYALERSMFNDQTRELKRWMAQHFPDHFSVRMAIATAAAAEQYWDEVIAAVENISRIDLDPGTSCHMCHLAGMAHFARGEIAKSLELWEEGSLYEDGDCRLEDYISYAKAVLLARDERKALAADDRFAETLEVLETVDLHLGAEDWRATIAAAEQSRILPTQQLQILGRLAEAYLHINSERGEMEWCCKVLSLAHFVGCHNQTVEPSQCILPPYVETWPPERLGDLVNRAEDWLASLSRFATPEPR